MTTLLAVDPGLNSGIALGGYSATEPYRLLQRWQVGYGLEGFLRWLDSVQPMFDEVVVEKFIFSPGEPADLSGVPIEGAIALWARQIDAVVIWQDRKDKAVLTGHPDEAQTKEQRQRIRFDLLDRLGMFEAGTGNDDSNDAVTHALVSLKRRRHMPTLRMLGGRGEVA